MGVGSEGSQIGVGASCLWWLQLALLLLPRDKWEGKREGVGGKGAGLEPVLAAKLGEEGLGQLFRSSVWRESD